MVDGWRFYKHGMIPTVAPHELANLKPIEDKSIWNKNMNDNTKPLLARWTTDFDSKKESNWWYCIKDEYFDISKINAKKRYEINKGRKNFEVKIINPMDYVNDIYNITEKAYMSWPEKYRPAINENSFKENIKLWTDFVIVGAFSKEDGKIHGYAYLTEYKDYVDFNMLRVNPEQERLGINAAIIDFIVNLYNDRLSNNFYILDGARSISHETAFQEYLEKYFGFRKAYCRLHIVYNPRIKLIIKILYPFRKIIAKFTYVGLIHKINGVLKMEEIARG